MGLSALDSREPVPGYRHKMVLCSHFEYQICDCVITLSKSYVTVYIVTSFRLDAILKHELSTKNKAVDCPDLTKIVCTQGPSAHFCARGQGRDLVLGHPHRAQFQAWVLEKGCVHVRAQRVPQSGTVPGQQVWTMPYWAKWSRKQVAFFAVRTVKGAEYNIFTCKLHSIFKNLGLIRLSRILSYTDHESGKFQSYQVQTAWQYIIHSNGTEKRATKNVQLVLQHCCKTSRIAMLHVLPHILKPVNNLICCKTGFILVV